MTDPIAANPLLPVDIVLAPAWWYHNAQITFNEDFFFHPVRRVEAEREMEQVLCEKWERFGLGVDKDGNLPIIGPVHLACGYMISEMLGCKVEYKDDAPPQVICANREDLNIWAEDAFVSSAFKRLQNLAESLKQKYGYITGDVNWSGILNIAMDLRGEAVFLDMFDKPERVGEFFGQIALVVEKFTQGLQKDTQTTSISVNRNIRHLKDPVLLHSECSHTMISVADYEKFLFKYDAEWSRKYRPYGIHFCGKDPHRYAQSFSKLPHLDFLDVGWGGNLKVLRKYLPDTFFNIRLSPVEMIEQTPEEISQTVRRLVADSGDLKLTGICCVNMDEKVSDEKITAIFETAEQLRGKYQK